MTDVYSSSVKLFKTKQLIVLSDILLARLCASWLSGFQIDVDLSKTFFCIQIKLWSKIIV